MQRRSMQRHSIRPRYGLAALLFVVCVSNAPAQQPLRPPAAFEDIQDRTQRSRTIFEELSKVLTHPRCLNCHPAGDRPLQGSDHRIHYPPARRAGPDVFATACSGCHTDRNFRVPGPAPFQSIPGHPRWDLAPPSMAWEGKSLGEICRQLKDKDRNGGRDLALLHEHIATDDLVA